MVQRTAQKLHTAT